VQLDLERSSAKMQFQNHVAATKCERMSTFLSPIPSRFNHSIKDWRSRQMWLFVLCQEHSTDTQTYEYVTLVYPRPG
jgi:hypothetical protein